MFVKENLYRIFCNTENKWISVWSSILPITCPNNTTHLVNSNSISITEDGKKNNNSEIQFNSSNDLMGVANIDVVKTIRISSSNEPINPGTNYGCLFKPTGSADIYWKSENSGEAVNLVRKSGGVIQNFYGAGPYSTSSNNFIRAVTWNTSSIPSGFYRIGWSMYCNVNSTNSFNVRICINGLPIQIFNSRSNATNAIDTTNYSYFWYCNLDMGSQEIGVDISVSGSKTFRLTNVSSELWQIN